MLIVMNHLDDCCELGWDYLQVSWTAAQTFIPVIIVIIPTQGLTSSLNSLIRPSTVLDFIVLYPLQLVLMVQPGPSITQDFTVLCLKPYAIDKNCLCSQNMALTDMVSTVKLHALKKRSCNAKMHHNEVLSKVVVNYAHSVHGWWEFWCIKGALLEPVPSFMYSLSEMPTLLCRIVISPLVWSSHQVELCRN